MACQKSRGQTCDSKFVPHVTLLLLLWQLLVCIDPCHAIGKDRVMLQVGLTFGTKSGALIGMKYFVAQDVALSIDFFGAPMRVFGISLDASYYPPFLFEYSFIRTGMSCMFGPTSIIAANLAIGANTPSFGFPPVIESENKNNVSTAIYLELGVGRILWQRVQISKAQDIAPDQATIPDWYFPNVELGLRQGPF